jgi:hypothetical protein
MCSCTLVCGWVDELMDGPHDGAAGMEAPGGFPRCAFAGGDGK